jgi:hypothetical protein
LNALRIAADEVVRPTPRTAYMLESSATDSSFCWWTYHIWTDTVRHSYDRVRIIKHVRVESQRRIRGRSLQPRFPWSEHMCAAERLNKRLSGIRRRSTPGRMLNDLCVELVSRNETKREQEDKI